MGYGETIKKARKAAGLTQKALAEKAGLSLITIQQYEADKRAPKLENMTKLAEALEIPTTDLMPQQGIQSGVHVGQVCRVYLTAKVEMEKELDFVDRLGGKTFFLNDEGKDILMKYVDFLYSLPEYRKSASNFKKPKRNVTIRELSQDYFDRASQTLKELRERYESEKSSEVSIVKEQREEDVLQLKLTEKSLDTMKKIYKETEHPFVSDTSPEPKEGDVSDNG